MVAVESSLLTGIDLTAVGCVPIRVEWGGGQYAWVGSDGRHPSQKGVMEISAGLAKCLELTQDQPVRLTPLPRRPDPTRMVLAAPATAEDWDVIESAQDDIVKHLQSQLDVLTAGRSFPFWIHGHSLVILKVTSSHRPHDLVLLGDTTEIAIQPIARPKSALVKPQIQSLNLRVCPELVGIYDICHPGCCWLHPIDAAALETRDGELINLELSLTKRNHRWVNRVSIRSQVPLGHVYVSKERRALVPSCTMVRASPIEAISSSPRFPSRILLVALLPQRFGDMSVVDAPAIDAQARILASPEQRNQLRKALDDLQQSDGPCSQFGLPMSMQTVISIERQYYLIDLLECSPWLMWDSKRVKQEHWSSLIIDVGRSRPYKVDPYDDELMIPQFDAPALRETLDIVRAHFEIAMTSKHASVGIRVEGRVGVGKSHLLRCVAYELRRAMLAHICWIDCSALCSDKQIDISATIRGSINDARRRAPCLIVFDALDTLCPAHADNNPAGSLLSAKVSELIADSLDIGEHGVAWACTVRSAQSLHESLRVAPTFPAQVRINPPNPERRHKVIDHMLKTRGWNLHSQASDAIDSQTEGFTCSDLLNIVERSIREARSSGECKKRIVDGVTMETALQGYVPSSLQSAGLHESRTTWADIGGLEEVRCVIEETLTLPSTYSCLFERAPLKLRSGILIYGPPGTGKTLMASAIAKECGLHFIAIAGAELLNKYIGASEEAVRDVFSRASAAAPCILFFDEFEAIAPRRGSDAAVGVTDRVVNQMLCHLDGIEERTGVYVLAASSRPDLLDPALLRPGRFDKSLYCGLPDLKARIDILRILSRQLDVADDVDWDDIASKTIYFSGADLQGVIATAQRIAVHEYIEGDQSRGLILTQKHIQHALQSARASVSTERRIFYERVYAKFRGINASAFCLEAREGQLVGVRTALK